MTPLIGRVPVYLRIVFILALLICLLTGGIVAAGGAVYKQADVLAFTSNRAGAYDIYLLDVRLGLLHRLTSDGRNHLAPAWSPDGERIAFNTREYNLAIQILPLAGEAMIVRRTSSLDLFPAWSPDGGAIGFTSRQRSGQRLWLVNLADGGGRGIGGQRPFPYTRIAWSPDGLLMAYGGSQRMDYAIYVSDIDGEDVLKLTPQTESVFGPPDSAWRAPAWSPDGTQIVFHDDGLYLIEVDGGGLHQLTDGHDGAPTWSPDGRRIAFTSRVNDNWELFIIDVDGGNLKRVTTHPGVDMDPAWRP